ncbi:MAG: DUF3142 domain-containing protein [Candidatus Zixiibacteriota bacterium]
MMFAALIVASGIALTSGAGGVINHTSYWIWAGITAADAPANSELFVLQGEFRTERGKTSFTRAGLYPYPITCKRLSLVYRLQKELPDPGTVVDAFRTLVVKWGRHGVVVAGLQIDFDSPTAKLAAYGHFIEKVRTQLSRDFELSIAGLGDWATNGDTPVMQGIASNADEIIFQLYQGRSLIDNVDSYIRGLQRYPEPFRIGLLSGSDVPNGVEGLKVNPHFLGIVYFIQRSP